MRCLPADGWLLRLPPVYPTMYMNPSALTDTAYPWSSSEVPASLVHIRVPVELYLSRNMSLTPIRISSVSSAANRNKRVLGPECHVYTILHYAALS